MRRAARLMLPLNLLALLLCASLVPLAAVVAPIEFGSAEERIAGQTWGMTPDPALPDVLILGDSISIGYTLLVRKELAGVANVHRPLDKTGAKPANCSDTANGLKQIETWLGQRPWKVIHFNFGLHDLKYLDAKGAYVAPDQGKQVAPPDVYEARLRALVERLKKTGAVLIWGSTTPVPDGSKGRVKGDEAIYNAVAAKVMRENGVAIDDLAAVVAPGLGEWQLPNNVHFTEAGSKTLAAAVARSIKAALKP